MTNLNERFTAEPETKADSDPSLEPDPDLALKADMMGGQIKEWRKSGEMRLAKVEVKEGKVLWYKAHKIEAKLVLLMMDGRSEPMIFGGSHSEKIDGDTVNVMFNCINDPRKFREMDEEFQEGQKAVETPKAEKALEIREGIKNVL